MEKTPKKNKSVQAVPEGFHTVTPYLVVEDARKFIDFVKRAFNGKETFVHEREDGKIMHATVKIGDSTIMLGDTMEGMEQPVNGMLYLYVDDVDKLYKQAITAKATPDREPKTEFYGDRAGCVKDAWGNTWWISTHVEDVEPDELERRSKEMQRERKEHRQEAHA